MANHVLNNFHNLNIKNNHTKPDGFVTKTDNGRELWSSIFHIRWRVARRRRLSRRNRLCLVTVISICIGCCWLASCPHSRFVCRRRRVSWIVRYRFNGRRIGSLVGRRRVAAARSIAHHRWRRILAHGLLWWIRCVTFWWIGRICRHNRLSDERSQREDKITSSNTKLAVRKYGTVKVLYSAQWAPAVGYFWSWRRSRGSLHLRHPCRTIFVQRIFDVENERLDRENLISAR